MISLPPQIQYPDGIELPMNVASNPKKKALRIFSFVRDNIRWGISYSRSKASQTLIRGCGDCASKTNLHMALLRAAGIPSRLRWVKARREALHGMIFDWLYKRMPSTPSHFWPECYLAEKWISCDSMLDKSLYEGLLTKGLITKNQIPTIDWDGQSNLILLAPWIIEDRGYLSSVDDWVETIQLGEEGIPPLWLERIIAPIFFPVNMRCTDKLRQLASGYSAQMNR